MAFLRLDCFLANQMNISRAEAKELIKKRLVTVNGETAGLFDARIDPLRDVVSAEGTEILYREHVYIMLNKPAGTVCATRDRLSETVLELIPPELRRKGLFPAGRLDKDTVGFVLITDDGGFAHSILSPRKHVEKKYFAVLEKNIAEKDIDLLKSGITIDGGEKCLPADVEITQKLNEIFITIHEGKYHQVKRMAEAVGNKVLYLKRVSIGGLALDENLKEGECREITAEELLLINN
ncbi:MAG: 16S rRNA pseudouridine(516) synthase [Ruminococcus sp.]|nr:16S rRNA pseudouridine(516) synthase [Ruminococcus sp.]MCM1382012.1 16S rRNA pseudouridine(516) synthase [Muribaculaceae bacterium]